MDPTVYFKKLPKTRRAELELWRDRREDVGGELILELALVWSQGDDTELPEWEGSGRPPPP